ncbi:hypothetical protein [Rufibacter latericius]|uniref:Uncharacterized protein n=1 Tax=Rufibacter latericius TaxID=2487040 RepID=A0A3M9MK84_9BACT|nr:hypothetical protein [Rufibacter latericius]RNI25597.1 hypothetical protein EFB08_12070 [Rufibacter latericius]
MENLTRVNSSRVFSFLLKIFVGVIMMSLIAVTLDHYFKFIAVNPKIANSYTFRTYLVGMFDCNGEKNIPTYFSFMNLILSAGLLFTIGKVVKESEKPGFYKRWYLMGFLFIFLALDELLMLHEIMGLPFIFLIKYLNQGNDISFVRFTGFIPYFIVLVFSFVYFINWFLALPRKTMVGFVLSGGMVVFGALGVEMIGEFLMGLYGKYSYPYKVATTVEESFEMLGILFFIKFLIDYLETQKDLITLTFDLRKDKKRQFSPEGEVQATPRSKQLI